MVTAIIPAYNESERIKRAILALGSSPLITEIIVVDDGSNDNTAKNAYSCGAAVIKVSPNKGKGNAMNLGVLKSQNEIILFCDADMYGFEKEGLENTINPVLKGNLDMSVAVRPFVKFISSFIPFLIQTSGFRVLKKASWNQVPVNLISGYQIELTLNEVAKVNNWKVEYTTLPGLKHTIKEVKYGFWNGFMARIKMIRDIFHLFLKINIFNRNYYLNNFKKSTRSMDE